jgi:hypothetical protein
MPTFCNKVKNKGWEIEEETTNPHTMGSIVRRLIKRDLKDMEMAVLTQEEKDVFLQFNEGLQSRKVGGREGEEWTWFWIEFFIP